MTTSQNTRKPTDKGRRRLIDRLRELVEALDRRIPQAEREGEERIARDSARLKKEAQERIAQLETTSAVECAMASPREFAMVFQTLPRVAVA